MLLKKLVSNCPSHLRNIKISDLTSDSREVKKNSFKEMPEATEEL